MLFMEAFQTPAKLNCESVRPSSPGLCLSKLKTVLKVACEVASGFA